jgi:hypothetical protein
MSLRFFFRWFVGAVTGRDRSLAAGILKATTIFVAAFLLATQAHAVEVPRALAVGNADFSARSLGAACFGMDATANGLPCNPAFTGKEREAKFQTEFFFGNNVSYVKEVSHLLEGTGDADTVNTLFSQKSSSEMEARIEASYVRETWGVAYSPYRLFYYSLIRNSSLPVITLYAGQEQILTGQVASFASDDFFWGLQLRGVDRRFVLSEFTLTDAVASGGERYFQTQSQRALYIEPGFLYSFENQSWKPQAGLTIKNAGLVDHKYEDLSTTPEFHLAGSVKPPVGFGELELGLDLLFMSQASTAPGESPREARDIPHLAASYSLGAMQALGSYGDKDYSAGFLLKYGMWNGGLTYWRKKYETLLGERDQLQTVYLEIGFIL